MSSLQEPKPKDTVSKNGIVVMKSESDQEDSFSNLPLESRLHIYINRKQKAQKIKPIQLSSQIGQILQQLDFINYLQSLKEIDLNAVNQEDFSLNKTDFHEQKIATKIQSSKKEGKTNLKLLSLEEANLKENTYVQIVIA